MWGCGQGSEGIAVSFRAPLGLFNKIMFSYWAIKLHVIISPHLSTPPRDSSLQLYPHEHLAFWSTFLLLGQSSTPCNLKKKCYTLPWGMFSLLCRIQRAVCEQLWDVCGRCSLPRGRVRKHNHTAVVEWGPWRLFRDTICFFLPPRSWFQEKRTESSLQIRFSLLSLVKEKE